MRQKYTEKRSVNEKRRLDQLASATRGKNATLKTNDFRPFGKGGVTRKGNCVRGKSP